MDRLTQPRMNGIKTGYWTTKTKEEVVQSLGKYEDTGLTPEDVRTLMKKYEGGPFWLRPEEKKPPLYERVLIARVYEPGQPLKVEQATLLPDGWWKVFGTNCKKVEYWMPMPKAPEVPR